MRIFLCVLLSCLAFAQQPDGDALTLAKAALNRARAQVNVKATVDQPLWRCCKSTLQALESPAVSVTMGDRADDRDPFAGLIRRTGVCDG